MVIAKRLLFIVIVVVFAVGLLLAGCKEEAAPVEEEAVEEEAVEEEAVEEEAPTITEEAAEEAVEEAKEFDFTGQTVNVIVIQGPQVAKPFLTFGKEWEEATGGTLNIIQVPYGDLYTKMATSFATGAAAYDMLVVNPAWVGDWIPQGFLEPVPDWVKDEIDLDDVLPCYSETMLTWGGELYLTPYDADCMFVDYRKDIVNPDSEWNEGFKSEYGYDLGEPKTWEQYYDIAEFFNGKDWDNDGEPEAGVVESQVRKAQSLFTYFAHAGAYAKHPDIPYYFFDGEMDPMINNPGYVAALEDFKRSTEVGMQGMLGYGIGEMREAFIGGNAILCIDWADIGTLSIDPASSKVEGKVGFCMMPGSNEVWNSETEQWDKFDEPSYGPYMAFGGWSICVASNSEAKDAAWSIAAFMGGKEQSLINCITPESGVNPGRYSIFENIEPWIEAGLDRESAEDYLDAIKGTLDSPNVIVDMRIPGSAEYQDVLDREISRALAGEITPQEALDNAAAEWDAITDRLGRDEQLKYYKASLGL